MEGRGGSGQARRRVSIPLRFGHEALQAFHALARLEGILPALESSHAVAYAMKIAPKLAREKILLVNLSGRGDKDMQTVGKASGIEL